MLPDVAHKPGGDVTGADQFHPAANGDKTGVEEFGHCLRAGALAFPRIELTGAETVQDGQGAL
jgi:hypothetical protein